MLKVPLWGLFRKLPRLEDGWLDLILFILRVE
jgi:hypothetical protein